VTPADLRVLLERATPGPWKAESGYLEGPAKSGLIGGDVMEDETGTLNGFFWKDENAQAIVALRTLAPHLLDLWDAAEKYEAAHTQTCGVEHYETGVRDMENFGRLIRKSVRALREEPGA